jgi:heme/copper-type cytochrome/quinol oxidase subunit 3
MEFPLSSPFKNKEIASNGIIGMIFLLATEAMFFAGLISAYIVNRSAALAWPPYGQPRLPIEITALNSVVLISSAVLIFFYARKFKSTPPTLANPRKPLVISILLGGIFVVVQGTEWIQLLGYGLTTTSSLYGAFFYLIIGAHAIHVIAGLLILLYLYFSLKNPSSHESSKDKISICSMYWYFVVGIWPLLYALVYLI